MDENPKLYKESYVLYDRVMNPLAAQLERKPKKDRGTRRGRQSTSSSTFNQPSSSHLNDDDDDGNNERTPRASTPSPMQYVNSLTNEVPQVFQNPPNIDPHLEPFYTHQTKIINRQVQIRDEHRGGLSTIVLKKSLRQRAVAPIYSHCFRGAHVSRASTRASNSNGNGRTSSHYIRQHGRPMRSDIIASGRVNADHLLPSEMGRLVYGAL
ncbi:hypothetical protein Tco_0987160 [Tanacetum coccineum]